MQYPFIPEDTAEITDDLRRLEELWNTLNIMLLRAHEYPAKLTPATIAGRIAKGENLGLLTTDEAKWLLQNIYWITPQEDPEDALQWLNM